MQPLQSLSYCNSSLKHIRICHKERFLNESQSQLDIKILLKYNYIQVLSSLILQISTHVTTKLFAVRFFCWPSWNDHKMF